MLLYFRFTPVVVCDEITKVVISVDGETTLDADVFDDGSYDFCSINRFLVRRESDNCGIVDALGWNPTVTFCCEDSW